MINPLIAKLTNIAELSDDDRRAIEDISSPCREVAVNDDIIADGERPDHVHLMLDGWSCRYKLLADGSRQITAYLIPGDFCDLHVTVLGEMDHGIAALTSCRVAYIPRAKMAELTRQRPELTRALWWATLVDEGVLRAWLVNLGRREGFERVANLMCELHERMKNIGLVEDGAFDLPLTQIDIADSVGLTPAHVNRVVQRLRRDGLITLRSGRLTILEPARLRQVAGFDPSYLHARRVRGS